ncbi:hypothetical protein [Micromonospora sp. LOL_023]|uniref:hypothetical protein n=1 Tax=Micromonospora sp. LOL_023 TaxID=3345418 RepID=UPI003A8B1A47
MPAEQVDPWRDDGRPGRRRARDPGEPDDTRRPSRRRRADDDGRRYEPDFTSEWLRDDPPAAAGGGTDRRPGSRRRAIGGSAGSGADLTGGWSRGSDYTGEWSRESDYTGEWSRESDYTEGWQREDTRSGRRTRAARRELEASRRELDAPRREPSADTGTWTRAPRAIGAGPEAPRTGATGRPADRERYGPEPANGWRGVSDYTGQWHRGDDPESWPAGSRTGARKRLAADIAGPDEVLPPVDPWPSAQPGREGTFWSGTRLAADDPRWVETPLSAPRSPMALPSAPRSRADPEPRSRPRYEPPSQRRLTYRIDDELIDADQGGYLSSLLYTAAWYALPVVAFLIWSLTLDGTPATNDCVLGVDGDCLSAREQAISSLIAAAPAFAYALMISLVLAVLIRWVSGTWRASSAGLAAAVIGGGMSQVLASAITGQPIG